MTDASHDAALAVDVDADKDDFNYGPLSHSHSSLLALSLSASIKRPPGVLWAKLRALVRTGTFSQLLKLHDRGVSLHAHRVANSGRIVAWSDGKKHVPKTRQMNPAMYTPENIKKRRELRSHPDVASAIERWWTLLPKKPAANRPDVEVLPRDTYLLMNMALQARARAPPSLTGQCDVRVTCVFSFFMRVSGV